MFTINLEDGREAPSKARKKGAKRLEFLVNIKTKKICQLKGNKLSFTAYSYCLTQLKNKQLGNFKAASTLKCRDAVPLILLHQLTAKFL